MTTSDETPIADETLMAYADGELEPAERATVEAALATNPELARRVEQHRALRRQIRATYDPVMLETLPERLVSAADSAPVSTASTPGAQSSASASIPAAASVAGARDAARPEATVTDLRRVRAARAAEAKEAAASARRSNEQRRPWTWIEWGSMAASIVLGALIAHLVMRSPSLERIGTEGGQLVARADLAMALDKQLASDQPATAPIQIGVSFRSKAGEHCRTFVVKDQNALGGLACRQGGEWRVPVLANARVSAAPGAYEPASAQMPPAVLAAVEQRINGDPFDAEAEVAARDREWK
jgi:hypothetical protein